MPKSNINGYGIRRKDHRLKYLSFEGDLNENESIEVNRRGLFITHSWTLSYENNNFIKLKFEDGSGSFEDMWKKTDFKISLDEIKLYEVTDPAHFQKDREISSRVTEPPQEKAQKEAPIKSPPPQQKMPEEKAEVQASVTEKPVSVETTGQGTKPESTVEAKTEPEVKPESQAKDTSPEEASENISPESPESSVEKEVQTAPQPAQDTLKKTIIIEEAEISYTPVQEFILDETGKPNEEYNKK